MKKIAQLTLAVTICTVVLNGCSKSQIGMKGGNTHIELHKEDFQLSERVSAEAKETRILGIDFSRLFNKESANFNEEGYAITKKAPVPVIGNLISATRVQNYALHKLLTENSDYDVILYPNFEQKSKSFLFFYKKIETKVSARMGKL